MPLRPVEIAVSTRGNAQDLDSIATYPYLDYPGGQIDPPDATQVNVKAQSDRRERLSTSPPRLESERVVALQDPSKARDHQQPLSGEPAQSGRHREGREEFEAGVNIKAHQGPLNPEHVHVVHEINGEGAACD